MSDIENIPPSETRICFSKQRLKKSMYILSGFLIADPVLAIILGMNFSWAYFFGAFIMFFLILILVDLNKKYKNGLPQIIINDDGIATEKVPFNSWQSITGEDAIEINENRMTGDYLVYDYSFGRQKLSLSFLETNKKDLKDLLKVYRDRYNKKIAAASKTSL